MKIKPVKLKHLSPGTIVKIDENIVRHFKSYYKGLYPLNLIPEKIVKEEKILNLDLVHQGGLIITDEQYEYLATRGYIVCITTINAKSETFQTDLFHWPITCIKQILTGIYKGKQSYEQI